jgi:tryptophan halogenase
LDRLEGAALSTPRRLRFVTGRRHQAWNRNCLALGLAAGFLEPLESTSIHLIQTSILRLISLFPDKGFEPAEINEFNRQTRDEYDDIRDFLITHYKLTARDDTAFWRHCRDMAVPDRVAENLDLFAARGRLMARPEHLFSPHSWLAVLIGQGLMPRGADPLLEGLPEAQLAERMNRTRQILERAAAAMPRHEAFIGAFCRQAP